MATISAELVTSGEKRDLRGRKLAGDERRDAVLAAYDRCGGMTQREFARSEGVSYHTLVTWLVRRRRETGPVKQATVQFREVGIPAGFGGLEVCLPGGEIVRGQDAVQVAALIKALR
jgi:DNA-binding transcriptional regulator YiaG